MNYCTSTYSTPFEFTTLVIYIENIRKMSTENLKSKTSEKPLVFGVRTYTKYVDQREVFKNLLETSRWYSTRSGSTIRHLYFSTE